MKKNGCQQKTPESNSKDYKTQPQNLRADIFVGEVYQAAGSAALFNLPENLCAEQFFSSAGMNFLTMIFTLDILRENGFFSLVNFYWRKQSLLLCKPE